MTALYRRLIASPRHQRHVCYHLIQHRCPVLRCAVLCCAVLCCAVLCCAVLCCAVLCCAEAVLCLQLNEAPYCPRRDYKSNRLVPGRLQLSGRTQVLVDETVMATGQLQTNGILNLQASCSRLNPRPQPLNLFWMELSCSTGRTAQRSGFLGALGSRGCKNGFILQASRIFHAPGQAV